MKRKISLKNEITESDLQLIEYHSILNILNIIGLELQILQIGDQNKNPNLDLLVDRIMIIADQLRSGIEKDKVIKILKKLEDNILEFISEMDDKFQANLRSVFSIMEARLEELNQCDSCWHKYKITDLLAQYTDVFKAVEKNAKGKYKIKYNFVDKNDRDYLVSIKITGMHHEETISLPNGITDTFRDLIMNSRKYTQIGGEIYGEMIDDGKVIKISITDNGIGIPDDEIDQVVEFGYRATNVKNIRTMGDGFGLTKAFILSKKYNGSMWIESELGKGTVVTLEIPKN